MILVFGKTGQVATELALQADVTALDRDQANLADPAACARAIIEHMPKLVINAAAYTAVDKAEDDAALAALVNSDAPIAMAQACAKLNIPFVHISTDYVFDGLGDTPYPIAATTKPLGVYGRTKLQGEQGVRAAGGTHVILRTSWVFSEHGNNFLKTMLRLGAERLELRIVADQVGGPTPARAIAKACLAIGELLKTDLSVTGTYHFSGTPDVSWAGFAKEIFRAADLQTRVVDIPSSEFPTPAARPANSRLDCRELSKLNLTRPDWRTATAEMVQNLKAVT